MLEVQYEEFKKDLAKQFDRIEGLTAGTPYAINEMKLDFDLYKDLKDNGEEKGFWLNFKEIAPLLFGFAVEPDSEIASVRDQCVNNEIRKTKAILKYLYKNFDNLEGDKVNLHQFSTSLKTLQEKINVIKALKAPPMDSENLKINIAGTEKRLVLNINKLHEAIYFEPIPSEDNKKDPEPIPKVKKLDFYIPPNDHKYLSQTLQGFKVTEVKEGLIQKHSMVQMLKFIGDFAKLKNEQNSKEAQIARLEHYGKDDDLYIETIKNTLKTEEENYNYCTKSILFKLKVEHDVFVKSEQALLSDPFAQFELMKNSFDETTSDVEIPELLDKETSIDIIKKANDMAFSKFKQLFRNGLKVDPSMIPVLITCLSHDYIFDVFGYSEEVFKAVIQHYKIFDDPDLSIYIQNKQIELMKLK